NVLMSFQGEVKLTDFGIARASLKMMETVSGIVKGRFDYMSPEQAEGRKDLDQRSDLFSVGVVLYEMLTGVHPFRAESEIDTVERVRTGKYTAVSTRNPEVPFALQTIVDRALQVDRDRRYPSATAFKEALDRFFHDAGFIFTHATLASYVKGLFPESQKKRPRSPGTPTGGMLRSEPLGPRRPSDATERVGETWDPPTGPLDVDAATPTATATSPQIEDLEPTAVRSNPLVDSESLDPTKVGTPAYEPEEMATVIRESPFTPEELEALGPPPEASHYPSMGDSSMGMGMGLPAPTMGQTRPPHAAPPIFEPERPPPIEIAARPALIGWLGVVLSIVCLIAGMAIGSVFGSGTTYLLGVGAGPSTQPVVRILSQNEVDVWLDGEKAPQNFTIPANEPKSLEVRTEDYAWSIPLRMAPGEVKVFIISVPKPAETPKEK
ncbi:MAG: serine/threonine protein kinase, partial [Myxococcales bacterium]|nr:serine/threonine protein kinase [Myxococcales bacterium]